MIELKFLVLGDSGLLGNALCRRLSENFDVVGVSRSANKYDWRHTALDVTNHDSLSALVETYSPDVLVNCVAVTNVDECERSPIAHYLNEEFPGQCCDITSDFSARFAHISTDAVFSNGRGCAEDSPISPVNEYARQKANAELQLQDRAIVIRTNFFGLRGGLAAWLVSELQQGHQIPGFTDVFFSPIHVLDLADVLADFLAGVDPGNDVFHVVSGECLSKYDFAVNVCRAFGFEEGLVLPSSIEAAGLTSPRPRNTCISNDKVRRLMGRELPTVRHGIQRMRDDEWEAA